MTATVIPLKSRTLDVDRAPGWMGPREGAAVATLGIVRAAGSDAPLISAAVAAYLTEGMRRGHFARTTHRTYQSILGRFARDTGNPPLDRLTRRHVWRWYGNLDCAPSTTRHRLSVVQTFLDWTVDRGDLRRNPATGIKPPKQPRHMPRALTCDEVARILDACPRPRCRLIVLLMCQMGLRCAEVTNLQYGDIDWQHGTILVRGKGDKERVLPMVLEVRLAIDAYLADQPCVAGPLVRSYSTGRALSPGYIGDRARRLFFAAGVKATPRDGKSAHSLRHTFATDTLNAGANVRAVQAALGHESLTTTQRYLAWNVEDLRRAMEGRVYRAS